MAGALVAMISSTTRDLPLHREAAIEACQRQGVLPRVMEYTPPADRRALPYSLDLIDDADIYVLILAFRYGAAPDGETRSYTHLEYEHAVATNKPVIVLLMSDEHPVLPGDIETGRGADRVQELRRTVKHDRVVQEFSSVDDMKAKLIGDLVAVIGALPARPARTDPRTWVPVPPEPFRAHPYTLLSAGELVGRRAELDLLTGWLFGRKPELRDQRVLVVEAIGGMGKSALAWTWFHTLSSEAPGLAGRIWWSFYDKDSGFDAFVLRALEYVTQRPAAELRREWSAGDRADALLEVLDRMPFVIVLDGVERLLLAYSRPDAAFVRDDDVAEAADRAEAEVRGKVTATGSFSGTARLRTTTDPQVGAFLRRLPALGASRVLVTSRLYPRELQRRDGRPLAGSASVRLTGLADDDALALWRDSCGGRDDRELLALFHSWGNYPLLIRALSAEVAGFRPAPGDYGVWRRANPDFDPFDPELLTSDDRMSHALEYAMRGLSEVDRQVLQTVAAFTAPVRFATLRALLIDEAPFLADDAELDRVLGTLEDRGLLGWDRAQNRYDLHPVVRGVSFAGVDPEAQKAVYQRLANHFGSARESDVHDARSIEDLADRLELCRTLTRLEQLDGALALIGDLIEPLLRVGALSRVSELVEGILRMPGWAEQFNNDEVRAFLPHSVGLFAVLAGDPERMFDDFGIRGRLDLSLQTLTIIDLLRGLAHLQLGHLQAAEQLVRAGIKNVDEMADETFIIGIVLLRLGDEDGERWLADHHLDYSAPTFYGQPLFELGRVALRRDDGIASDLARRLTALADKTHAIADEASAAYLSAAVAARRGPGSDGLSALSTVLAMTRAARLTEHEIVVRMELARWHRLSSGALGAARAQAMEAVELADRSQLRLLLADALVALSQVELARGDRQAASDVADRAYRTAWCDGGRHSYHAALAEAADCLAAVGAPVPVLVPAEVVPMEPLGIEPESLAEMLRRALSGGDETTFLDRVMRDIRWTPPDPDLDALLVEVMNRPESSEEVRVAAREAAVVLGLVPGSQA